MMQTYLLLCDTCEDVIEHVHISPIIGYLKEDTAKRSIDHRLLEPMTLRKHLRGDTREIRMRCRDCATVRRWGLEAVA